MEIATVAAAYSDVVPVLCGSHMAKYLSPLFR